MICAMRRCYWTDASRTGSNRITCAIEVQYMNKTVGYDVIDMKKYRTWLNELRIDGFNIRDAIKTIVHYQFNSLYKAHASLHETSSGVWIVSAVIPIEGSQFSKLISHDETSLFEALQYLDSLNLPVDEEVEVLPFGKEPSYYQSPDITLLMLKFS